MTRAQTSMIEHRTRALATVFLTSRNNVAVIPLDEKGGLSSFCKILEIEDSDERIFGVIHCGTSEPLADERGAEKALHSRLRVMKTPRRYPFPVLILLFSMPTDEGFFAWMIEPEVSDEGPALILNRRLACERATRAGLDSVLDRVRSWYGAFYKEIVHADR